METKGPIGDLCGSSNDLGVLASDFDRIRGAASQEIEVDHSSDDIILQGGASRVGLVDFDVHSV